MDIYELMMHKATANFMGKSLTQKQLVFSHVLADCLSSDSPMAGQALEEMPDESLSEHLVYTVFAQMVSQKII